MSRVVVIGAGVAGLAAARQLRNTGHDVVVLERTSRPGGVIRSSRADGFLREHAANGFLGSADGAAALAEELGVEMCEAAPAAKRRWIYVGGRLRAVPASPLEAITTDLVSLRGKLAMLAEPLRPAGDRGVDESVGDFARRRLGDEAAHNVIAPMVTGIFAGDADRLSLRAAFPIMAELDAEGGLIRGGIKRMLAKRRHASAGDGERQKRGRMSAPLGGVEALVRALAADIGGSLRTDAPVVSLSPGPRVHLDGGEVIDAGAVVLATPAYAAARLASDLSRELSRALDAFPYAPALVVHLGFDRTDVPHPLDGFGFLVAPGEKVRILGCVFESVLWPGRAPDGCVLLRCVLGGQRDPEVLSLADDELVSVARRDLSRVLGIDHKPVHVNVARWERAIAQYEIGHTERVEHAESLATPLGVVLAGSAYHGVAVNSCVADAKRVLAEVTTRLGALALLLLLGLVLAACGSSKKSAAHAVARDGGDAAVAAATRPPTAATPEGAAPPYHLAAADGDGGVAGAGSLSVRVTWSDPPAELLRSPGLNACGQRVAPPVSVHTLNGLRDAVVTIEGIAAGVAPPPARTSEIAASGCALSPRVQVASRIGAELAVRTDDLVRHRVALERTGSGAPEALATLPLPLAGQRYQLPLDQPGTVHATLDGGASDSWIVVPRTPYVAVTDDQGRVRFDGVPPGTYSVVAWHPPVERGGAPALARASATIGAGTTAELELEPRPW